jgi:hypothetical protein
MEDIEKELGPLLDTYNKKYEENKVTKQKKSEEIDDLKDRFNKLIEDVIKPEMNKFKGLLEKKGLTSSITVEPQNEWEKKQKDPSITFSFNYRNSSHSSKPPSITFLGGSRTIDMFHQKWAPHGSGSAGKEESFNIDEITGDFIRSKMMGFFKELFDREWPSYDLE